MSPDLIGFAIRSLLRLGNAGSSAFAQYARDKEAVFPDLKAPEPNLLVFVTGFFAQANRASFVEPGGAYAEYWTQNGPDPANPHAVDALYIAIVKIRAEEGVDLSTAVSANSEATAGLVMLDQWSDDKEPVGPLARVLVTIADIALEYVAVNPSIAGVDGRGEKLLTAFATSLSKLLPDDGNLGPKHRFAERLFAVALRAGSKPFPPTPTFLPMRNTSGTCSTSPWCRLSTACRMTWPGNSISGAPWKPSPGLR